MTARTEAGTTRRAITADELRREGTTTDIITAGRAIGIGRTAAHSLARRGEFPVPVIRAGGTYRVPVAPLLSLLGLSPEPAAAPPPEAA